MSFGKNRGVGLVQWLYTTGGIPSPPLINQPIVAVGLEYIDGTIPKSGLFGRPSKRHHGVVCAIEPLKPLYIPNPQMYPGLRLKELTVMGCHSSEACHLTGDMV